MKVAVFDTHPFDRQALEDANDNKHDLIFLEVRLTEQTAALAQGCEAVCLFANDRADRVVVTALGIKKEKKALGYAVSSIGKKDLELKPEIDVARILAGKAPGVNILGTSGLSGSGTNVVIRAVSTISGNAQPLWVVDGVPFDGGNNAQASFVYGNQTPSRF